MRILFDHCTPKKLRRYFKSHHVKTTYEMGWAALENGALLQKAEADFDIMITTDSNVSFQQNLAHFAIGLIVLRGLTNAEPSLAELMPDCLKALETIQPGEVVRLFTDAARKVEQRRKRRGRKD